MPRRIWAAFLAAATMMPTMAAAQDREQRGEHAERARADNDRARDQVRQQRQRVDQARERHAQQPERRGDRDQAQRQRAAQAQRVAQRQRPAQMLEQRAGQPDRRGDQRPAPNYRDRNNDGRAAWRGPRGYDRGRAGGNRAGVNRARGNRNGPHYRAPDYRRWNNNWRNDRRYDWRGYRGYNRGVFRLPRYYAPYGWRYGYRRYSIGVRIGAPLFTQNYWIADPWYYRLPPAYGGYRWVRYYNDALLVDVRTGYVVDVIHDIFW